MSYEPSAINHELICHEQNIWSEVTSEIRKFLQKKDNQEVIEGDENNELISKLAGEDEILNALKNDYRRKLIIYKFVDEKFKKI